jgi:hypothetical protein
MKKRKNQHLIAAGPIANPVAKFAHQFNKAQTYQDKTQYQRNAKHKKQEASPIVLIRAIGKAFCLQSNSAALGFGF